MDSMEIDPFEPRQIAGFANLFGDANPLHSAGADCPFPAPIASGALLSITVEKALIVLRPLHELVQMNLVFMRPIYANETHGIVMREGTDIHLRGRPAQRIRVTGSSARGICYIAECILAKNIADSDTERADPG